MSGWAGPHPAGLCSHCYQQAAGFVPLQESKEYRKGQGRAAEGMLQEKARKGRRPTYTLDHHGASPIRGLGPGYLLNIMNHHGADAVCITVAAVGKMKVGPSRSCLPYNATGSR